MKVPILQDSFIGQAVQEQPPVFRPSPEDGLGGGREGNQADRQAAAIRGRLQVRRDHHREASGSDVLKVKCTEIGKKAWLFAKLQPGRARKRINAT